MTTSDLQASTLWRLDGPRAQLDCGSLQAAVDVAAPARGLTQLRYRGAPLDGWLLGVEVAAEPSDAYVRGGDLVVDYAETAERPYGVQVYWSASESLTGNALILDATVSIQTRQWKAYPRVAVASSLADADVVRVAEAICLMRPRGATWSYAEVVPALDFIQERDAVVAPPTSAWRWVFREQFMERGVIRRLRVRGLLIPRCDDAALATSLHAALLAERPPLTA
jgi:hypothetical protein